MRLKVALLLLGASLSLPGQTKMTVEQLVSFITSSIKLNQPDRQVAGYLAKTQLSERLDDRTIEELQAKGAGPRTVAALEALKAASNTLPAPPRPTPTPPPPSPIPPPPAEEQNRVIEQAREYALNYTKSLPNFMCTQVTRRYVDPNGMEFWALEDVLTARLTYFEHKEDYKLVLVNDRAVHDVRPESVGGTTSAGEFGSMMKELFAPETQTTFRWERWATLRGRRAYVYSYHVAQPRSKWSVVVYGRKGEAVDHTVPGYHGLVFVDRDLLAVTRITLVAELPASFPVQQAQTVLDYDFATISGNEYLLPLKAVVRLREGRLLTKNEVEFRLYRKFTAEATITFDASTPEPLPADKTTEEPPK
jgi:hypothetical protein